MLNELLVVERGAALAGMAMPRRHPDIMDARRIPTLLVQLGPDGRSELVRPIPRSLTPWTLRDGNHNSFPFVQPKVPLWNVARDDDRRRVAVDRRRPDRRDALMHIAEEFATAGVAITNWPGDGLLARLRQRRLALASLVGTRADVVPASIDRFLLACDPEVGGDPVSLLRDVAALVVRNVRETNAVEWLDVATALLIDGSGAFLFDAAGDDSSIVDSKLIVHVSLALSLHSSADLDTRGHRCALTGDIGPILTTPFPQPNLPLLGQTRLFARNKDIPSHSRYGRSASETMPVGVETAARLAAAIKALAAVELKGKTWRALPGEGRNQTDLLVAFVDAVPVAPIVSALAEDDLSEEAPDMAPNADTIANFEERAERVIQAVDKVGVDFRDTPVQLLVLRKVDPANRKIVCSESRSVAAVYQAARRWAVGERNVPPWLTLPILHKGESRPRKAMPPHVSPLGLIAFSKKHYIHGGMKSQDVNGLPASEVFELFLDPLLGIDGDNVRRIRRVLQHVLSHRGTLVSSTAHSLRRGGSASMAYDRREALRTVTLLGVLLHKLDRQAYMNETAFQLGQLLAAADVVHAGYCADLRGGNLPPSLLGNQVFTTAQTAPAKALAVLCRRWKTYDGWARRAARDEQRVSRLVMSKKEDEQRRGWDIRKALRHARGMRRLADELRKSLAEPMRVNDAFRAELLLGYIAGLPPAQKEDVAENEAET